MSAEIVFSLPPEVTNRCLETNLCLCGEAIGFFKNSLQRSSDLDVVGDLVSARNLLVVWIVRFESICLVEALMLVLFKPFEEVTREAASNWWLIAPANPLRAPNDAPAPMTTKCSMRPSRIILGRCYHWGAWDAVTATFGRCETGWR